MADRRPRDEETPKERANRELIELLNELRVVLPGVTVLLAFLLAVPFAKGWTRVTHFQRDVFVVAFLATAVSVALLAAPSSYHRLRFRQGNKERLVRIGNRLAIAGITAFAVVPPLFLLEERYAAWSKDRAEVAAMEESGTFPAPGRWQGSDDEGVAILREIAGALGWSE